MSYVLIATNGEIHGCARDDLTMEEWVQVMRESHGIEGEVMTREEWERDSRFAAAQPTNTE